MERTKIYLLAPQLHLGLFVTEFFAVYLFLNASRPEPVVHQPKEFVVYVQIKNRSVRSQRLTVSVDYVAADGWKLS